MIKNKILITGSNGDIGKLLTKQFRRSKIIRYKRHNSKTKGDELFKYLEQLFKKKNIETVFHCATVFKGSSSKIYSCNYEFSKILFDISKIYKVRYFFNLDTILPKNVNLYSKSKYKFSNYLIKNSSIKVFNLKIAHAYSKDDNEKKFIPKLINRIKKNQKIKLTAGNQKRFFIQSEKLIQNIKKIYLNKKEFRKTFNQFFFISKKQIKIKSLVKLVIKLINKNYNKISYGEIKYRKNEIMEFNLKSMNGKIVVINSNLKKDLNEIVNR